MLLDRMRPEARQAAQEMLGYLNFSSGTSDANFLRNLNALFAQIDAYLQEVEADAAEGDPVLSAWSVAHDVLRLCLGEIRESVDAFRDATQVEAILKLVFEVTLPAYLDFHQDLLFHQTDASLFQPFFVGRACEAVLAAGGPWSETERIRDAAVRQLNDFVGYRPVAVLENQQPLQPYAHEWVRPIPLYIEGVGVSVGPYHDLITQALEILRRTDPALLREAYFDPDLLDELALDPRSFDFDHPVNRRPNYQFGCWDPNHMDGSGRYRRFVVQQVTLDALLARLEKPGRRSRAQLLFEAAGVLAGTMLMGSGISGSSPDSHSSEMTLATLLPQIAAYRDTFYEQLIEQVNSRHKTRLRAEAETLRQPFAGVRQDLNQKLSQRRARQLQHVQLARIFARMGYVDAAAEQAEIVPVAAARMRCEIDCSLTTSHLALDRGELKEAAELAAKAEDCIHRAIECGALVDPWNILGFGGNFSLFPAIENSVFDERIDELIDLMNGLFGLYARAEKEAAAKGLPELREQLSDRLRSLAAWWDKYASIEVLDVEGFSGHAAWESADQVATTLAIWHEGKTAAGDLAFWSQHVGQFNSPKAYALLIEALLQQKDPVAAMALLIQWLNQSSEIRLFEGEYSFHELAIRWMEELWRQEPGDEQAGEDPRRQLTRKFLDFLEANAESYWQVPKLEVVSEAEDQPDEEEESAEGEDQSGLFSAAYENVTYRDTASDGIEGETADGQASLSDFELMQESDRISDRLAFLSTMAQLWKMASANLQETGHVEDEVLHGWLSSAMTHRQGLLELLSAVDRYRIPLPRGTHDALAEYDQQRGIKEILLDRIIRTCVESSDAARFILASMQEAEVPEGLDAWEGSATKVLRSLFRGDVELVRDEWPKLLLALNEQPLLYIPTARGGNPRTIVASRSVQRILGRLLEYLPRLGLLTEAFQLMATIQQMERKHPVGPGAITEFDWLFEIGCRAIIGCLVTSSEQWEVRSSRARGKKRGADLDLIDCVEDGIELLLQLWLSHSRNIRLSVLESVSDEDHWDELRYFIELYGHDLFTVQFMNFGNLRAILHQGVDTFVQSLQDEPDPEQPLRLLEDIEHSIPREAAVRWLEVIIEAIAENDTQYIDYKSTTTQSDRGEMLYTLLDFLRLLAAYDRVAWNLKPVFLAHEVMVRQGRTAAATLWERAVAKRSSEAADKNWQWYEDLSKQYGMWLPSVADRLQERFIRPMAIDRACALVQPAIEEQRDQRPRKSFPRLETELAQFTDVPSGGGFDIPTWLEALSGEVDRVRLGTDEIEFGQDPAPPMPVAHLSLEQIESQMGTWRDMMDE